jgi:hypothetical protein
LFYSVLCIFPLSLAHLPFVSNRTLPAVPRSTNHLHLDDRTWPRGAPEWSVDGELLASSEVASRLARLARLAFGAFFLFFCSATVHSGHGTGRGRADWEGGYFWLCFFPVSQSVRRHLCSPAGMWASKRHGYPAGFGVRPSGRPIPRGGQADGQTDTEGKFPSGMGCVGDGKKHEETCGRFWETKRTQ